MQTIQKIYLLLLILICATSKAQYSESSIRTLPINQETGCYVRYYYFPNLQSYYDNLKKIYYYKIKGEWVTNAELPNNYCGYSPYNKTKVVITDFDGDNPLPLINVHKKLYPYNPKGRSYKSTASNYNDSKDVFVKT